MMQKNQVRVVRRRTIDNTRARSRNGRLPQRAQSLAQVAMCGVIWEAIPTVRDDLYRLLDLTVELRGILRARQVPETFNRHYVRMEEHFFPPDMGEPSHLVDVRMFSARVVEFELQSAPKLLIQPGRAAQLVRHDVTHPIVRLNEAQLEYFFSAMWYREMADQHNS